jgi:flagellar basal-body rod modification protein FlgD
MSSLSIDNSFASLNPAAATEATAKSGNKLGQADFMELLIAQIKHQDPSEPMDPSQFMDQLTQLTMVNGVQDLNNSFTELADKLSSDQSLQAANLVGREVLIPGGYGVLDENGTMSGVVLLPQSASDITLKIQNSNGEEVRSLPMGGFSAGDLPFKWDGFMDDGSAAAPGAYTVTAEAFIDGNQQAVEVGVDTRVDSITLDQYGLGTLLNLASGESVSLSYVQQIK